MEDTFLGAARKMLRAAKKSLKEFPSKLTKKNALSLVHRAKKNKKVKWTAAIGICTIGLVSFWPESAKQIPATSSPTKTAEKVADKMYYGMVANDLCIDEYLIKSGETLSGIL
ncbi:MAG TPA: hypothetical protein ENK85_03365, partial [Saprospiraceae bacterium]|nr:hypothetical protein [Saprospiraceae bacterium]